MKTDAQLTSPRADLAMHLRNGDIDVAVNWDVVSTESVAEVALEGTTL